MNRKLLYALEGLYWWVFDLVWWAKAKLAGRCHICGLKGSHKFSCSAWESR